jgi:hypothetical protein
MLLNFDLLFMYIIYNSRKLSIKIILPKFAFIFCILIKIFAIYWFRYEIPGHNTFSMFINLFF